MKKTVLNIQGGPYIWLTYQEAYEAAMRFGSAIRSRDVNPVSPKFSGNEQVVYMKQNIFNILNVS